MASITHFINPTIINIDGVDTKVEDILSMNYIPVHVVYDLLEYLIFLIWGTEDHTT
tara:strand:+ start:1388 stop:1555 length:168 start_codon:yes stop_codon:yes gene_type:complete